MNEAKLTGNPSIVALIDNVATQGSMQNVSLANLFNYARAPESANILSELAYEPETKLYPTAGFVNYNDVKLAAYHFANLPQAVNSNDTLVPLK